MSDWENMVGCETTDCVPYQNRPALSGRDGLGRLAGIDCGVAAAVKGSHSGSVGFPMSYAVLEVGKLFERSQQLQRGPKETCVDLLGHVQNGITILLPAA